MYKPPPPQTLEETVAAFVKKTRRDYGLTLQDVAEAGNRHGAHWYKSSINNVERGAAALTLNFLVPLCRALSELTEREITILDLIRDQDRVVLHRNSSVVLSPHSLRRVFVGVKPNRRIPPTRYFDPVEERAAEQLGVTPLDVRHLALERFESPLHTHLSQLLGEDPSPQDHGRRFAAAVNMLRQHQLSKTKGLRQGARRQDGRAPSVVRAHSHA